MTNKGWKNESYRHSAAARGIRTYNTNYSIQVDAHGQIAPSPEVDRFLESNGWISDKIAAGKELIEGMVEKTRDVGERLVEKGGDLVERTKEGYENIKGSAEALADRMKKSPEQIRLQEDAKRYKQEAKDVKRTAKQDAQDRKKDKLITKIDVAASEQDITDMEQQLEYMGEERMDDIGGPEPEPSLLNKMKGGIGDLMKDISAETYEPANPDEYFDYDESKMESIDADSIIATAENKEKLIVYSNDLKQKVSELNVQTKALQNKFRTEEESERNELAREKKLEYSKAKTKIQNIKTTMMDGDQIEVRSQRIKDAFHKTFKMKEDNIKLLRIQHDADIRHIKGVSNDLTALSKMIDGSVKASTARGVKRR